MNKLIGTKGPSIYGNIIVPSCGLRVYLWTFKILKVQTGMAFGITSDIYCKSKSTEIWKFWIVNDEDVYNYAAVFSQHRGSKGMMEYKYLDFANFKAGTQVKMRRNWYLMSMTRI